MSFPFRTLAAAAFALWPMTPVLAADAAEIDRLWQALDMPAVVDIMRDEGLAYGDDIDAGLLAGQGGAAWKQAVAAIYNPSRMHFAAHAGFSAQLDKADVTPLIEFFEGDLGKRIVGLEISARRALMEPSVTDAAKERLMAMEEDQDPRLEVLDRYITANDLIELNVAGGLNASFAFFSALAAETPGNTQPEADILSDVWATEEDLRSDTGEWVYSFLAIAYQPLSDAEIEEYTRLSETPAGKALNRALFAGFDDLFNELSRDLGRAAAHLAKGEEL